MIKLLLNKGVNANVWCSYQPEPSPSVFCQHVIFWAVEYEPRWRHFQNPDHTEYFNHAMMRILLEGGAKPNTFDMFGQTPLSYAIKAGHETVVKCLLDHGANPNWAVNATGQKLIFDRATKESIRAVLEEAEAK